MNAARLIAYERRKAGLSQRQLAERSGIKQAAIARIESGRVSPRVQTLDRLLAACGVDLESRPRLGAGVDRTMIRELLRLTPGERVALAVEEARRISDLVGE